MLITYSTVQYSTVQCEGGHDVAVGVDHGWRDAPVVAVALHDAGDLVPVAHPVQGSHKDATSQQEESRDPVVKLRHNPLSLGGASLKTNNITITRHNLTNPTLRPTGTKFLRPLNSPSIGTICDWWSD